MKLSHLVAGVLLATVAPVAAAHADTPTPPPTESTSGAAHTEALVKQLVGAYRFNADTNITVDGTTFVANAPGVSAGPKNTCDDTNPITNAVTSPALATLLRCFTWGGYELQGAAPLDIKVPVPQGTFEVSFWNWEDNGPEIFDVLLEGLPAERVNTTTGQWRILGPYTIDVTDGTLNVSSFNGAFNVSAMRIDQLVSSTPPVVEPQARFKPLTPTRILDTRPDSLIGYSGPKPANGATVDVQVNGKGGVPLTGVTAAVLNITATEAAQAGFVTAFASGTGIPTVSNVNPMYPGHTVPNLAIVPVGANGKVSLYTAASTHLLVDVAGYFTTAGTGTDGRFHAVTPSRVLDTRSASAINYTGPKPGVGAVVKVPIRGKAEVPSNAAAVAVTLTATEGTGPGFVTAYPSGAGIPNASNLNIPSAKFTVANMAIVPIGADGTIELYTSNSTDLLVDVQGWFGNGTEAGTSGYFVAQTPTRTADSRPETRIGLPTGPYAPPNFLTPSLGQRPAGQAVGAAVYNMTTTGTVREGFLASYPAGAPWPGNSNLNAAAAGATVAALSITTLGQGGALTVYHQAGGHLIIDVAGWFTA